jgi:hypothetical protein
MSVLNEVAIPSAPAPVAPPASSRNEISPIREPKSSRWLDWLFRPIPMAPLVYFRIVFGAVMAWECCRYLFSTSIHDLFIAGQLRFKYIGFEWLSPWPGYGMYIHYAVMGVLAVMIAAGAFYRVATVLFFLAFSYMFLLEESNYLNHLYLVCLLSFLLVFIPAHRARSFDARLRPHIRATHIPQWTLLLLIFQIGAPYFFGGIAKINHDWLRGEPMRMWMAGKTYPIIGGWLSTEPAVWLFSYGGLLLDLLIVPALLWRRTRPIALAAALLFHLINALIFNIGIFPWLMIGTLPLFFSIAWWRRTNERYIEHAGETRESILTWTAGRQCAAGLVAAYMLLQVAMPFRHCLYPGSVHWTEEGHRYSWHMKLRSKSATAKFIVTHPSLSAPIEIEPKEFLSPRQRAKMPTHPDMMLQFAHWLREKHRHLGPPDAKVHVISRASLNGRAYQELIDPKVNLAAEERHLWRNDWIVPLREPLHTKPSPWMPKRDEGSKE